MSKEAMKATVESLWAELIVRFYNELLSYIT